MLYDYQTKEYYNFSLKAALNHMSVTWSRNWSWLMLQFAWLLMTRLHFKTRQVQLGKRWSTQCRVWCACVTICILVRNPTHLSVFYLFLFTERTYYKQKNYNIFYLRIADQLHKLRKALKVACTSLHICMEHEIRIVHLFLA